MTALGLVSIYFACAGCQAFIPGKAMRVDSRNASKAPSAASSSPSPMNRTRSSDRSGIKLAAHTDENDQPDLERSNPLLPVPGSQKDELELSLSDAISTALSNNMHLRVISNLSEEVGTKADIERAQFDTNFNLNPQYMQGTQQVSSALQAVRGGLNQYGMTSVGAGPNSPNMLSAEQRFSTGTVARVGLGSNYNMNSPVGQYLIYNPAYQTAGSLILEQALFRGRSKDANMAGIRIAQVGERQSAAEFQADVNQTLADVQRAYWMAWLAESQLQTSRGFVEQAESTYALEKKRLELGEGGVVQSAAAAENLHSRRADYAQARQRSRTARNKLFTLLGIAPDDQRVLKMTDEPLAEQSLPDLEQGLTIAKQQRPELEVRTLQVNQAQLELDRRKNNLQPDLRAYAGYSLTGLNNSMLGSLNQLESGHFGSMSLGLRYAYVFGQRAEKAAVDQAQLALMRQTRARQETEFLIQRQVRDASDAVNSAWEVYQCQQERVNAARTQAETFRQLHAAGQIDLDRLLRADQQLSNALQQSHNALIDYNIALTDWRYATGGLSSKLPTDKPPGDKLPPAKPPIDDLPPEPLPQEDPLPERRPPSIPDVLQHADSLKGDAVKDPSSRQ